ncbi:calcineurin-like phosphoesterase family protein [Pedobacter gandavensis]|uniref:calcineurin-like phosphoesterase C-terminal domain-containing protein n=1 Tax=Pedobacter TaxID=84567 RepID=UPI001C99DBE3|nr:MULTISPECIES: calcineurin-like phosphoesterase family protein [Pedobacter]WGQ08295.1 calcineurin-like phosphoesterase family protein [Pedobacter gandavensis]
MNRRRFIQNFSLLTTGLVVSLNHEAFAQLQRGNAIKGRVTAGKKGLANVVVSDGYSVVLTDAKGNYKLTTHPMAATVWLSTPAGYEFPKKASLASHYHTLGSRTDYHFDLKRLKKDDQQHGFIIWADPQVKNKKDVAQMMETSVPDVQQLVAALGADPLIHGIGVGDLVWDNHALFEDYNAAVAQMNIPFFQALGNHDMDYRMGGDETSDRTFKEIYGPTYYSFNRGQAHYVVLDNVRYLGKEREYDGFISENQLAWLEKDLQQVSKDQLLIINLHIPVYNSVKNNTEFYALLEGYKNVHIMSGHTHYNANHIQNGIYEHNHGTVCGAWWTGPICSDGTPRGYGVYEVSGNELKWYYKSTGKDKQEQMRVYVDQLTNQTRLLANVWNWDPEWKVVYFLDGRLMGPMEQQKGFDPLAVKLYLGDQLPLGRTFAEPQKIDHLFTAHFDPSVKTVSVLATDRFGNEYRQEMSCT